MWSSDPGARVIAYGDFNVEVERARPDRRRARSRRCPPSDHRRLTTAAGTTSRSPTPTARSPATSTARRSADQAKTLRHRRHRRRARRPHPGRRDRLYDELAVYPSALDAARIAAHFDASCNTLPPAPQGLQAGSSEPNEVCVWFYGSSAGYAAPWGQNLIDHYLVEAWQGGKLRSTQAIENSGDGATLSGLPAGTTRVKVRAINGFGERPGATIDVTVAGHGHDLPVARRGRRARAALPPGRAQRHRQPPTPPATATRRSTPQPANQRTRNGAFPATPTARSATAASGTTALRPDPLAASPPACRPATARSRRGCWSDDPGATPISYGDFSVEARGARADGRRRDAARSPAPTRGA